MFNIILIFKLIFMDKVNHFKLWTIFIILFHFLTPSRDGVFFCLHR